MNAFYDFSYFLKPVAENEIPDETEKIKSEIKKINGIIIEEALPERRALSYPILKHKDGLFGSIKFTAEPESLNLFNLNLKKNAGIIRFMVKKEVFKTAAPVYKKRVSVSPRKEKITPQESKKQIAEIDKKLEEILNMGAGN